MKLISARSYSLYDEIPSQSIQATHENAVSVAAPDRLERSGKPGAPSSPSAPDTPSSRHTCTNSYPRATHQVSNAETRR